MTAPQPRAFPDFASALRNAYEEEISGETYFDRLADFYPGRPAEALRLMARMEAATVAALAPTIRRHAIACTDSEKLRAEGRAEADRMAHWPWERLLHEMRDHFHHYVTEFETVETLAPPEDKPAGRILIDHEVAIIRFAELESAGDPDSFAPLHAYLARSA